MKTGYQDYAIDQPRTSLFELLSTNNDLYDADMACAGMFMMNQAFKLAGSLFEVFDSATRDLVVPYGEGEDLISELTGQENPASVYLADWVRRARPYTIAAYEWQLKILGNAVTEYAGAAVLADGFYDESTGLITRTGTIDFLEV